MTPLEKAADELAKAVRTYFHPKDGDKDRAEILFNALTAYEAPRAQPVEPEQWTREAAREINTEFTLMHLGSVKEVDTASIIAKHAPRADPPQAVTLEQFEEWLNVQFSMGWVSLRAVDLVLHWHGLAKAAILRERAEKDKTP
jgi:hypothetical protein